MEKNRKLVTSAGILDLSTPLVMGVLNVTPDSFFDGGRYTVSSRRTEQAGRMLEEGASVIDVGAVSTRPGAKDVPEGEEMDRLLPAVEEIARAFPGAIISVDTCRSAVARECMRAGAHIVNDISGGRFDPGMFGFIAESRVPYVMMHIQGTPRDMQVAPRYGSVVAEVKEFLREQLAQLREKGVHDNVVIDPGFGFGKDLDHNFRLLGELPAFSTLGCPVMVGLSRKSMINKVLGTRPAEALNGTTVLNTVALLKGADILRVHDVKEAVEAVRLVLQLNSSTQAT